MNSSNHTCMFNNSLKNDSRDDLLRDNGYSEEEVSRNYMIAICVINVVLCFTAIFGNSAVLITIWKTSSLRSASNILLSSLAVSDLIVGLIAQPLFAAYMGNLRIVNSFLYFSILSCMSCTVSFFTITAIGVGRLLTLQFHLRYEAIVTPFRATLVVICIWAYSGLFSISFWLLNFNLVLKVIAILIICTLLGNFAVYLKIYLVVRRHQRQIQQQQQPQGNNVNILCVKRFMRSALNTFLVYILLLCCYMPFAVYLEVTSTGVGDLSSAYITAITLLFLNSSLNPLFYSWRDCEIRKVMKEMFFRCF